MFRKILAATAALTLGLGGVLALAVPASATPTDPNADHKVTVCHRTGSADKGELKNGYNEITVDIASSGYVKGGHTGHEQVGNGPGSDVIPAYDAFAKVKGKWAPFHFDGFGLTQVFADGTTGAEFLANGCQFNNPQPPPVVEVEEGAIERASCEAGVEQQIIVVTFTTEYVWNGEEWVLGETVKTVDKGEWTFVRDLTKDEQAELECDTTEPPVDPPTDDPKDPPADNPPADNPQSQPPTELPGTGAGDVLPWAGLGIALLLSGLLAYMVTSRRRSSSI
jgi:hypothetical protein